VKGRAFGTLALLASAWLAPLALDAANAPDRLDRFRELATTRLGLAQILDDASFEAYREIYGLLDEEIVESLASGGVFASTEFLQDRLDAFNEAWGASAFRLLRVGRLVVGVFQLTDAGTANSVRVYGRLRDEAALLTAMHREGRPTVYPLPTSAATGGPFLVAWEGSPSGRGTRELRLDLVRPEEDGARVVWSTAELFTEGLLARSYSVRGADIRIRYEVRYPGWAPGCDGQTEEEDVYRLAPGAARFVRVSHVVHNAWHRDMRASVARVFGALAGGDAAALAALVPNATLRARLPAQLEPEPACDAADGAPPESVSVAAVHDRQPWQLTFRRAGGRWRLTGASRVLQ
jgi:hypothetical protein